MPLDRHSEPRWTVLEGDARARLGDLEEGTVRCCVTSPPYFGLRDYGHDGQIGLEGTVDAYVAALVDVFRAVRRVLADDGTLWLNLGDSYAGSWGAQSRPVGNLPSAKSTLTTNNGRGPKAGDKYSALSGTQIAAHPKGQTNTGSIPKGAPYKPKDLLGIPWAVAFALRADGWYLRAENIWSKPNPMPESVTDRPTRAHEQVFLLSKSARYFYDAEAISEEAIHAGETVTLGEKSLSRGQATGMNVEASGNGNAESVVVAARRNKRTVWTVPSAPFPGAHFATFPPNLILPCILAGSATGDTVLDPFAGSGTTGMVALRHGRSFVGCELNPEYVQIARNRIVDDAPLLNQIAEAA